MRRAVVLAASAWLAMLPIPASAQPAPSAPVRGSYGLKAALNSDIRSTQPGVNRDFNTDTVVLHMVEGLVALRENAAIAPMLAERIDLSSDGLTYRFTLRQGITFHNGAPLTSAEVVWSLRRYLDPATQWRCLPDFDGHGIAKVVDIAAPDAATVTITLEKPTALFLNTMARPDCGSTAIVHPASLGPDGAWRAPVGTGPYRFGEWRRGQYIDLVRFDGYASLAGPRDGLAGAKIAFAQQIRFMVIPDSSAAKAALISGAIDIMSDVATTELSDLRARPDLGVATAPTMGLTGFLIQTRDPLLRDPRIRQALALSIDVGQIVQSVVGDDVPDNPSPIPSSSAFHSAAQAVRPRHDIAAAKRLLAEAGYRGQTIRMITNRRYPVVYDTAVAAQAMAADAGIKIELEVLDWATQLDRYTRGDYQTMSFLYSPRLDPSLSYEMISGPKDSQPRKLWEDPEALALIRRSFEVVEPAARQAIFDDLFRRFMAQTPAIILFNQPDYLAYRKGLDGVASWPAAQTRLWGVSRR